MWGGVSPTDDGVLNALSVECAASAVRIHCIPCKSSTLESRLRWDRPAQTAPSMAADFSAAFDCILIFKPVFTGTMLCEADAPVTVAEPVPVACSHSDPQGSAGVSLDDVLLNSPARFVLAPVFSVVTCTHKKQFVFDRVCIHLIPIRFWKKFQIFAPNSKS